MSTSTDGLIWFGIETGKDEGEFPFKVEMKEDCNCPYCKEYREAKEEDEILYFDDFEDYWIARHHTTVSDWEEKHDWLKMHPFPFEPVNVCSIDYPIYALAVPGSVLTAWRGTPVKIGYHMSMHPTMEAIQKFRDFLKEEGIEKEPQWYLSSYWG